MTPMGIREFKWFPDQGGLLLKTMTVDEITKICTSLPLCVIGDTKTVEFRRSSGTEEQDLAWKYAIEVLGTREEIWCFESTETNPTYILAVTTIDF